MNQRGEVTTPGHATVLLPSREHGPVRLPDPPGGATDLQQALDAIAADFADGTGVARPMSDYAAVDGLTVDARRRRSCGSSSTGPTSATPSTTR